MFMKKNIKKPLGELKLSQVLSKHSLSLSRYECTGVLVIVAPNLIPALKTAKFNLKATTILIVFVPDLNNLDLNFVLPTFSFHPSQLVKFLKKFVETPKISKSTFINLM